VAVEAAIEADAAAVTEAEEAAAASKSTTLSLTRVRGQ
jgi:hypothetical protein